MRFRLLLLCLPVLLGACSKTNPGVQLDLIGASGLTSGNRTASPSDTLLTRVYAVGNNDSLRRLRIVVNYEPGLTPIAYPTPLSSFDPKNAPEAQEIVYLDSLIKPAYKSSPPYPGGEYLFNNTFAARTTSGTERWQYTVTDKQDESASRAYRITVRQTDSAQVYHRFTALLRPVPGNRLRADSLRAVRRVYLNLRTGLLLPKFAVLSRVPQASSQALVDLIALSADGNSVSLSSPNDTRVLNLSNARWPTRRTTVLKSTTLSDTDFNNAASAGTFVAAFAGGTDFPNGANTGSLSKNEVIAFQVKGGGNDVYTGLLLVTNIVLGTSPTVTCTVKVQKVP
ncbi:hypothetical protein MUN81_04015 [Hymenobacter sp. 5317J-9]|uniref:hypothetical protein n=1 Tax=Hymenobacter sp. 5317J-9 TaxID=2932250 RepID=UPI001FD63BEF|nr:hypothetical protein [Hymenobacter sp. 5317J-9]UOQ98662.1 hypothetical protein MUN81_04015 [Hymenobacter sp. 5317J-9]